MSKFKKVSTLVVDCSDWGFGPFEVLIVPGQCQGHPCYDFYLRHPEYGPVMEMDGVGVDHPESALVALAYSMAPDYIPDYIEEVIDCE